LLELKTRSATFAYLEEDNHLVEGDNQVGQVDLEEDIRVDLEEGNHLVEEDIQVDQVVLEEGSRLVEEDIRVVEEDKTSRVLLVIDCE